MISLDIRDLISPLSFAQSRCHAVGSTYRFAEDWLVGKNWGRKFIRTKHYYHFVNPTSSSFHSDSVMTRFRPCIDLHSGQVKQIVGGTLSVEISELKTNYVSKLPSGHYAQLYKDAALSGAHVIMLGPGNEAAAQEALSTWPGALQLGGGINDTNAKQWIEKGAEKVILTSSMNVMSVG